MTTGTLSRWGNGQGILIPKSYCARLDMKIGDKVNLSLEEDRIAVTPEKSSTIEALLKGYTGPKPQEAAPTVA